MSGFKPILTPSSSMRVGPPIVPIWLSHQTDVVSTPLLMFIARMRAAITFESLNRPLASASRSPANNERSSSVKIASWWTANIVLINTQCLRRVEVNSLDVCFRRVKLSYQPIKHAWTHPWIIYLTILLSVLLSETTGSGQDVLWVRLDQNWICLHSLDRIPNWLLWRNLLWFRSIYGAHGHMGTHNNRLRRAQWRSGPFRVRLLLWKMQYTIIRKKFERDHDICCYEDMNWWGLNNGMENIVEEVGVFRRYFLNKTKSHERFSRKPAGKTAAPACRRATCFVDLTRISEMKKAFTVHLENLLWLFSFNGHSIVAFKTNEPILNTSGICFVKALYRLFLSLIMDK